MKRLLILILVLSFFSSGAQQLSALFSYCSFDQPSGSPYIETYLHINGTSAVLKKNEKGLYQAKVEVQLLIKKDTSIVYFDKFNMLSPEMDPTDSIFPDFIDQHRVELKSGKYSLEMKIADRNSSNKELTLQQEITLDFPENKPSISDIEYLESYEKTEETGVYFKSGYKVVPYVNTFYPKEFNKIRFYAEIYRSAASTSDILIRYYVNNSESKKVFENLVGVLKQKASDVNVVIGELPISGIPSGNYNLNIEVRDRDNNLIAYQKSFFQRSNQQFKTPANAELSSINIDNTFVSLITNQDTVREYLNYLYPISSRMEVSIAESQLALNDMRLMQQYFYSFWSKRDPEHPNESWETYLAQVEKVNSSYSTRNKKGYETDRGRVYLQYGEPNSVAVTEDPSAYPYEIWHYYKIASTGQTNRRFVFYTTDRSTNDFRLLHSDARGELQDNAWELKLHSRTQRFGSDIDRERSDDIYGSRTKENFTNPR